MCRVENAAAEDAVVIHLRDGSARSFDRMHAQAEIFLGQLDAGLGRPRQRESDVLDALDAATPESREAVLRENSGSFMKDLDPADPAPGPPEDLSE